MAYNYPPSSYISKYGPLEPNTHFFVKGHGDFDRGNYECDFEVAFTETSEIILVCYLTSALLPVFFDEVTTESNDPDVANNSANKIFRRRETGVLCKTFSGVENRRGWNIIVEEAVLITEIATLAEPAVFMGTRFRTQVGLDFVSDIPGNIYYQIVGLSYPLKTGAMFQIGAEFPLSLEILTPYSERTFPNQPTARLSIPQTSIPVNWKASEMVDLWCAMISLAIGKDVRWTSELKQASNYWEETYHRQRNLLGNRPIFPFISNTPYYLEDQNLHRLIRSAFSLINLPVEDRGLTASASSDYVQAIRRFIEYLLITNRTEDQARLITTMIEEFIENWETHSNRKRSGVIDKLKAESIWKQVKKTLKDELSTAVNAQLEKSDEPDIEGVIGVIYSRLSTFFKEELPRSTYKERLTNLFLQSKPETEWFEKNIEQRLSSFVITRNTIAHTGRFPSDTRIEWLRSYYQMIMIFPLAVFAIIGYEGHYIDIAQIERDRELK